MPESGKDPEPQLRAKIDRLAQEFEAKFRSGGSPRIEDYLERLPEARHHLLSILIPIENRLRKATSEPTSLEEYWDRFPEEADLVESLMSSFNRTIRDGTTANDEVPTQALTLGFDQNDLDDAIQPAKIGRYHVRRTLGHGGFGVVYLAEDPKLDRLVAIKMSRYRRTQIESHIGEILNEARTAAKLKHPGLVSVFDVAEENDQPYIVQDYIDGEHLGRWFRATKPDYAQTTDVFIGIADALAYAHEQGLTHCDLKLSNILMDSNGQPHIADFGLAVHESELSNHLGKRFGTPNTMAPEQVRGEGHRLDGRTDIWALGVILYQVLTGRKPFEATESATLFDQILNYDPRPPRQLDHRVPRELDRICSKCLSRRRSDRYGSAQDLADDLRDWQRTNSDKRDGTPVTWSKDSQRGQASDDANTAQVLPKGLRSFDEHDADFFLSLLPGPRDRDGLPESIRFWKTKVEETDLGEPFSVGLIYGPSGCGKSSFVKAGLLPILASHVTSIYVEATASETEARLARLLKKRFPESQGANLRETLSWLRTHTTSSEKVLIVIDQFEQWLNTHHDPQKTQLIDALRQCDGESLQCILIFRDDFWMAANRVMREIEVPVAEGVNSAAVDLFSQRHSRYVLTEYGRALGALPASGELLPNQSRFVERAIEDLAQDGKVNCVRLALLTEMMSQLPWTTSELDRLGGLEGVGIAYLDEKFVSKTSPPRIRVHQQAARSVLETLLPESGDEIRGGMHSQSSLFESSGCSDEGKFGELLAILDGETRLITPCEPEPEVGPRAESQQTDSESHYQLTHDYLVPSIRAWLNRQKRETREGRALLTLADRTNSWKSHRETKQLPTWMEWMSILILTNRSQWSTTQRRMMQFARRAYGLRMLLLSCAVVLVLATAYGVRNHMNREAERYSRESIVKLVEGTNTAEAIQLIDERLDSPDDETLEHLRARLAAIPSDSKGAMHLRMALLPSDPTQLGLLSEDLLRIPLADLLAARESLVGHGPKIADSLWQQAEAQDAPTRIRALALLATFDERQNLKSRWRAVAQQLTEDLLNLAIDTPSHFTTLRDAFHSVGPHLYSDLRSAFEAQDLIERRYWSTAFLSAWTEEDLEYRAKLLLVANERQFEELVPAFAGSANPPLDIFRRELASSSAASGTTSSAEKRVRKASRQANAALVLLRSGHADKIWPLFATVPDPNVRSFLIERSGWAISSQMLVDQIREENDPAILSGLILALGSMARSHNDAVKDGQKTHITEALRDRFAEDTELRVRSASQWAMAQWRIRPSRSVMNGESGKDWYQDQFGFVMRVVRAPVEFQMGSPRDDTERYEDEAYQPTRISHSFAIATKEVSVAQYRDFIDEHPDDASVRFVEYRATPTKPQTANTWHQAALFCNWLSDKAGFEPEDYCYKKGSMEKGLQTMLPVEDIHRRRGYRLPTEEEWEFTCRAGTTTSRYFGDALELLPRYAYRNLEGDVADSGAQDVGHLIPNDFGLYDMLGNVREWSHGRVEGDERILRGGSLYFRKATLRCAYRAFLDPSVSLFDIGFRVAITLPDGDSPPHP